MVDFKYIYSYIETEGPIVNTYSKILKVHLTAQGQLVLERISDEDFFTQPEGKALNGTNTSY